jgi:hypothetical protein
MAIGVFQGDGITVVSPCGYPIIEQSTFVRFTSDPVAVDDETVQTLTLVRILSSDAVYVLAIDGYVGRTTCYEIGRVIQARHPIYFSARPFDLPIAIPAKAIVTIAELSAILTSGAPRWLFDLEDSECSRLERALVK